MKLCDIVCPKFVVNDEISRVRTGQDAITVAIHCLLRWLSGGRYLDIRLSAGISLAKLCMDAILESGDLACKFPSTAKEVDEAALGFE